MNNASNEPFDCKMCGHCCHGEGGIVVSPTDLSRLCEHLSMSSEEFIAAYGEYRNGKLKIRTAESLDCIFFQAGKGCAVHEAKPDICRAWPYFRGNLVDKESLEMAKEFCPGIRPNVSHEEFVAAGRSYLRERGLGASNRSNEANALIVDTVAIRSKE